MDIVRARLWADANMRTGYRSLASEAEQNLAYSPVMCRLCKWEQCALEIWSNRPISRPSALSLILGYRTCCSYPGSVVDFVGGWASTQDSKLFGELALPSSSWYVKWYNNYRQCLGRPCTNSKWTKHTLVILVGLLSMYLAYDAVMCFKVILELRGGMDIIWEGQTEQGLWGIGQIAAPFSWMPLLVDMGYSSIGAIQSWWMRRDRSVSQ